MNGYEYVISTVFLRGVIFEIKHWLNQSTWINLYIYAQNVILIVIFCSISMHLVELHLWLDLSSFLGHMCCSYVMSDFTDAFWVFLWKMSEWVWLQPAVEYLQKQHFHLSSGQESSVLLKQYPPHHSTLHKQLCFFSETTCWECV